MAGLGLGLQTVGFRIAGRSKEEAERFGARVMAPEKRSAAYEILSRGMLFGVELFGLRRIVLFWLLLGLAMQCRVGPLADCKGLRFVLAWAKRRLGC